MRKFINEIKLNKGLRPKVAILTYRISFFRQFVIKNSLLKLITNLIEFLFKLLFWTLSCGDLPSKGVYIDWGLKIPHAFCGVIMTSGTRIGKNCTILHNVTFGSINSKKRGYENTIIIGDNVFIGTGTIILGNSSIGSNVSIGAGTRIINETINNNCTVVSQFSNRIINTYGSMPIK